MQVKSVSFGNTRILFVMIHELFKIALSFLMNNKPQAQIVVKMRLCSEITLH